MAKRKPGRKPKDRSAYMEKARELRRQHPTWTANRIGNLIAEQNSNPAGLAQSIRKQLKNEEKEVAKVASRTSLPTPVSVPRKPPPPAATALSVHEQKEALLERYRQHVQDLLGAQKIKDSVQRFLGESQREADAVLQIDKILKQLKESTDLTEIALLKNILGE